MKFKILRISGLSERVVGLLAKADRAAAVRQDYGGRTARPVIPLLMLNESG